MGQDTFINLTLCMSGNLAYLMLSADFICLFYFLNLSCVPSQCQTFWTQIKPDIMLNLILVQTVGDARSQRYSSK